MKDIIFMIRESEADNQRQRGVCWQVKEDSYIPISHPQIKANAPRVNNEGLLESLNRLPVGSPGRIEPEKNKTFRLKQGTMNRSEFYPRIMLPILGEESIQTGQSLRDHYENNSLRDIQKQEEILIEMLEVVFMSVHPHENNFEVYGHQIRNLLILATTEVESSFTAILQANGICPINHSYTTNDYVCLNNILKLTEYEVALTHYPWLQNFSPFNNWDATKPTKSLSWYNSYNKIKHNREAEFQEAKLLHSINAIIAVHLLLIAQFGEWGTYKPYFKIVNMPFWPRESLYILPEKNNNWSSRNHY